MANTKVTREGELPSQDEEVGMNRRVQYAALPYRVRQDGAVQIRLITSRETRRWVIPKGWPIKGLSPSKTAEREAYEEAGLLGSTPRKPVGMYSYEKRLSVRSVLCDVMVFPLKVKRKLQNWPERSERVGFWFTIESAAFAVNEEELKMLILDFGDLMARKWEEKKKPKPKQKEKELPSALPEEEVAKPVPAVSSAKAVAKRKATAPADGDVKAEKKKLALGAAKGRVSKISGDAQGGAEKVRIPQKPEPGAEPVEVKSVKAKASKKGAKGASDSKTGK